MKIYISGPISEKDWIDSHLAFQEASGIIARAGHTPINPRNISHWDLSWDTYMNIAMDIIRPEEVGAVYMLNGWEESRGSRIERVLALQRGIPVWYQMKRDREKYGGVKSDDGEREAVSAV